MCACVCAQRDAFGHCSSNACLLVTPVCACVCVYLQRLIRAAYYIKGRKRNTYRYLPMRFGELSSKLNFAQQSIEKIQIGACVSVCGRSMSFLHKFNFALHQTFFNCYINCLASEQKSHFFASIGWKL